MTNVTYRRFFADILRRTYTDIAMLLYYVLSLREVSPPRTAEEARQLQADNLLAACKPGSVTRITRSRYDIQSTCNVLQVVTLFC